MTHRLLSAIERRFEANLVKRAGFTLVELLVVITVIAVLAAVIFPVFASTRGKARATVCLSNERQIGMAMAQYAQDWDDLYPYAADPSDLNTPIWNSNPQFRDIVPTMKPLQDVLATYIKGPEIWHCPSDSGYDELDMSAIAGRPTPLAARPTAFDAFKISYLYRTELPLNHELYSTSDAYEPVAPYASHGPQEMNVLMDGNGSWHGGIFRLEKRYNVLMGDGHAVSQNVTQFYHTWSLRLHPGS